MAHVGTGTAGKVLTARGVTTQAGFKEIGTLSGLTDHGVLLGQGADPFVATAAGATGEVLTGVTGGDPVWAAAAVGSVLTDNATPQFAVVGSTSTVDFGISNLVLGSDLAAVTSGVRNVGLGLNALDAITSGFDNTAVGHSSSASMTTGANNTSIGFGSLQNNTGANNNTALGYMALNACTDAANIAIGVNAMLIATTAEQNVSVGNSSMLDLTTGDMNTAVGTTSLANITTGSSNTVLGHSAGSSLTTTDSSNILVGNGGTSGDNNTIRIGAPGSGAGQQNKAYVAGITGVTVAASAPIAVDTNGQISSLGFGTAAQVLTSNGAGTSPSWQAAGGGVTSVSGTLNRVSSTGGATPVIDIDAAYVGQTSITTLGTVATGTWSATNIALNKGGTNAALTASNGGIFYSTATAGAILAGTATAGKMLRSGASTAPTWSTATFPNTAGTSGNVLQSDGTNFVSTTPGSSLTSFTPTLTLGGASVGMTYTQQLGYYYTIGKSVTFTVQITLSAKGSSTGQANISISGIGSTPGAARQAFQVFYDTASGTRTTLPAGCTSLNPYIDSGSTNIIIAACGSGTFATVLTDANIFDKSSFVITGTYLIA